MRRITISVDDDLAEAFDRLVTENSFETVPRRFVICCEVHWVKNECRKAQPNTASEP